MEKTRQYYDAIQEATTMMFRIAFKEYYPTMPTYDIIQSYDTNLLRLNINDVLFEVKENDAVREVEAKFHFMLEHKTDNWLNPQPSIMYDQNAIKQRLKEEGYNEEMIEFYLDQVYKVQCSVSEKIEFIRRMLDFLGNPDKYKGVIFDEVLSPTFTKAKTPIGRFIDEEKLKTYFNRSFFGAGMSGNYWLSYIISLRTERKPKDFACIASMTYFSKFLQLTKKPQTFKEFYKEFCRLVGCQYKESYKPSKLTPPNDIKTEFGYLLR